MRTEIVYEDQDILICHKPAGLATQAGGVTQPDVVSELKGYLKGAYLGIVHRLDQPVEGLLVFARNKRAAAALSRQLEDGTLDKRYCVLVCGRPPQDKGEMVDYLSKEGSLARVAGEDAPGAKRAVLQYQVRQPEAGEAALAPEGVSLLEVCIGTGRFHQIRCQLSHAGLPVVGDRKYGTPESLEIGRRMGLQGAALCAYRLQLRHPVSGREISREIFPDWLKRG